MRRIGQVIKQFRGMFNESSQPSAFICCNATVIVSASKTVSYELRNIAHEFIDFNDISPRGSKGTK